MMPGMLELVKLNLRISYLHTSRPLYNNVMRLACWQRGIKYDMAIAGKCLHRTWDRHRHSARDYKAHFMYILALIENIEMPEYNIFEREISYRRSYIWYGYFFHQSLTLLQAYNNVSSPKILVTS
jgi:hypothetical protein